MSSQRRPTNSQQQRDRKRQTELEAAAPPPQPQPVHDRAPQQRVERIGDILRRTRDQRGDDIGHIADYLCIRRSYLEAIENSDYEKFPADAYVIGFLRSYADLLGLDGKEAINLYRAEMAGRRKKPVLSMPTPMPEGRSPSVFILIGAAVTAILVYVLWYGLSSSDRATVTAPPPLPASTSSLGTSQTLSEALPLAPSITTVPVVPPSTSASQSGGQGAQPAAPAGGIAEASSQKPAVGEEAVPPGQVGPTPRLSIRAQQSSWIMVSDAHGQTVYDKVLKPGETYKVPDQSGLTLTTGNGAGIILTLDGADLPHLSQASATGTTGIIRDIPLDTGRLKAYTQAH